MTAVADRGGVTRRAVYLHFPGRAELVGALFDYIAGVEGLEASLRPVWEAPDAVSALDQWAAHLARYQPRLLAVDRAAQRVWRQDPDAAVHAGGWSPRSWRTPAAWPAGCTTRAGWRTAGPSSRPATCCSR